MTPKRGIVSSRSLRSRRYTPAGLSLDDQPARPEAWWADSGLAFPDLRTVVLYVIIETATHAGHLDAARELIDGRQHLVL